MRSLRGPLSAAEAPEDQPAQGPPRARIRTRSVSLLGTAAASGVLDRVRGLEALGVTEADFLLLQHAAGGCQVATPGEVAVAGTIDIAGALRVADGGVVTGAAAAEVGARIGLNDLFDVARIWRNSDAAVQIGGVFAAIDELARVRGHAGVGFGLCPGGRAERGNIAGGVLEVLALLGGVAARRVPGALRVAKPGAILGDLDAKARRADGCGRGARFAFLNFGEAKVKASGLILKRFTHLSRIAECGVRVVVFVGAVAYAVPGGLTGDDAFELRLAGALHAAFVESSQVSLASVFTGGCVRSALKGRGTTSRGACFRAIAFRA